MNRGSFFSLFYLFACCVVIGQVQACMRRSLCASIFIYLYALNFSGISLSSDENKKGFVIGVSPASIRAANEVDSRLLHYRGLLSLFSTAFHTAESLSNPRLIAIMIFSHHNSPDVSLIGIHRWRAPINRPHLSPAPSEQKVLACALRQIVSQLQLYHIILLSSFTGIEK